MAAYQSSRGVVSDFIQRYHYDNIGSNWGQLKMELTSKFVEITDPQHAFVYCKKLNKGQMKMSNFMQKDCFPWQRKHSPVKMVGWQPLKDT